MLNFSQYPAYIVMEESTGSPLADVRYTSPDFILTNAPTQENGWDL